jgi:hypothetical protein
MFSDAVIHPTDTQVSTHALAEVAVAHAEVIASLPEMRT